MTQDLSLSKPRSDFNDHFYISIKNKYAFHTIGKAANSTVKFIFYSKEVEGTHYKPPNVHIKAESPLLAPFQLPPDLLTSIFDRSDFFKFTFVRNPYSRLLSCYLDRILPKKSRPYRELLRILNQQDQYLPSFSEFVEAICDQDVYSQNNHWRVQYFDAMCDKIDYQFIGKQESFLDDINHIYSRIFNSSLPSKFQSVNASPSQTSAVNRNHDFWDSSLKKLVAQKYSVDFDFFMYSHD
jgi:hypothetical protein